MRLMKLSIWASCMLLSVGAQAQLVVEISKSLDTAIPIAVVPFGYEGASALPMDLAEVVAADLKRSGQFKTLATHNMLERPASGAEIDFADWQAQNVDLLTVGRITTVGKQEYRVQFQLFDSLKKEQLLAYTFKVHAAQLRRTAHRIADLIYEHAIGVRGVFSTRLAYVNKVGQEFRLVVADADGENPQVLARSPDPLMSPVWSPDGQSLAYVVLAQEGSVIYIQNLKSGKRRILSEVSGVNGAPAFSPDGKKLSMTLSSGTGNLDVYVLDLLTKAKMRVTKHRGIDTEAVWLSDSATIVFTSDRSGSPQLYQTRVGLDVKPKRLTFEGKYNARARVAPDQTHIAFVHQTAKGYHIATMNLLDRSIFVLTDGRLDESPSFAPNGTQILYATEKGYRGVLSGVSSDGRTRLAFATPEGDVREPAWSPFFD